MQIVHFGVLLTITKLSVLDMKSSSGYILWKSSLINQSPFYDGAFDSRPVMRKNYVNHIVPHSVGNKAIPYKHVCTSDWINRPSSYVALWILYRMYNLFYGGVGHTVCRYLESRKQYPLYNTSMNIIFLSQWTNWKGKIEALVTCRVD